MNWEAYAAFKEQLGWKPDPAEKAPGPVLGLKVIGNLAYISGHVPFSGGELKYPGRIGAEVSIEDGKKSAALSTINCLDTFDRAIGLNKLESVVKVTGYLCCTDDVTAQPSIMNGGSEVLVGVFGEAGRHARAALGIHTLPLGASTEVEMIVSIKA